MLKVRIEISMKGFSTACVENSQPLEIIIGTIRQWMAQHMEIKEPKRSNLPGFEAVLIIFRLAVMSICNHHDYTSLV